MGSPLKTGESWSKIGNPGETGGTVIRSHVTLAQDERWMVSQSALPNIGLFVLMNRRREPQQFCPKPITNMDKDI